ncbi:MAG: hypothetical protein ABEJ76_08580 [Halanaeroarchaeum sp.]
MRTRTVAILLIVAAALLPTWFAAMQGGEHAAAVGIDTSKTDIRPLQAPIDTPNAFTPAQVGVIIWIALGTLVGILIAVHRFMDHLVRPNADPERVPDGGSPSWFRTEDRWIAEYLGAAETDEGLYVILALTVATVVLSALVVVEFLTLARTQYFGFYVGGIFFSLAGMAAAYYAWFLPHVTVAEERYHE